MNVPTQLIKTDEQNAICDDKSQRLIIEANAGAAKTTTAAMKIARLIANGADPSKIVALSFSDPGVKAYKNAFRRIGLSPNISNRIRVGTFEDFCAARLKHLEGVDIPRYSRPEEVRAFLLAAIKDARIWVASKFGVELSIEGTGELAVEGLLDEFEQIKGSMQLKRQDEYFQVSPDGANAINRSFTTLAIFKAYEKIRCVFVDDGGEHPQFRYFGDATYDLANIVNADDPCFTYETNPLRLNLQAVILDEMHDTNWAMFTVLDKLLDANDDAFFLGVGDRDQVIHAQHGAESYFMGEGFDTHIGKPQRLKLTGCFRFGEDISQPLSLFAAKGYQVRQGPMSRLEVKKAETAIDLLGLINITIAKCQNSPKSQIAVLLRHPSAAVELEHVLRSQAIKYQTVGFTTYLERPEVLYVRTLLGMAVGIESEFHTGVAHLAKRATWAFMSAMSLLNESEQCENFKKIEAAQFNLFVEYILPDALGLKDANLFRSAVGEATRTRLCKALDLAASDSIECLSEVIELLDIDGTARRVFVRSGEAHDAKSSVVALVKASQTYASISQFLRSLMAHDYAATLAKSIDDRIVLSTIEAAKGLEFEHVIIPEVTFSNFDGNASDERNLFYVAVSRARESLILTYRSSEPSSYLQHFHKSTTF